MATPHNVTPHRFSVGLFHAALARKRLIYGGDVPGKGNAENPGSDGASPYLKSVDNSQDGSELPQHAERQCREVIVNERR
jgi:hypothetical protein